MFDTFASHARLLLIVCTASVGLAQSPVEEPLLRRNFGLQLSENDEVDGALERALGAFLGEAKSGTLTEAYVDLNHVAEHGFYFKEVLGMASTEVRKFDVPTVLKSYTKNERDYFVTVSFTCLQKGAPFTYRIIEFKAVPSRGGYRFYCPLDDRTEHFQTTKVDEVTYRHSGPLSLERAEEFARFQAEFCEHTGTPTAPLDYYKFETLDELLTSHGVIFSASKCNFLAHDLGFIESDGRTYMTGTDDAAYICGYVEDYLERHVPGAEEIYSPCAVGLAVCYGNYFTSGDDLPTLKAQFRAELVARPDLDFLAEFKKGRSSSIERHFCHFVMCAFLCEEVLQKEGFSAVLKLVQSGEDGERFMANLKTLLGVDESNFHGTILRLIHAPDAGK